MISKLKVILQGYWDRNGTLVFQRKKRKLIDTGFGFLKDFGLWFLDGYWTINQLLEQSYSLDPFPARANLLFLTIDEFTVPIVDSP